MTQNIHKLFENLKDHSPSDELRARILKVINAQEQKSMKAKIMLTYAGFASSLAIFVYAVFVFGESLLRSEFWSLAKLIFTDAGVVASHWVDFSFSLLETFPVILAVIFLVPVFMFFLSLSSYFRLT